MQRPAQGDAALEYAVRLPSHTRRRVRVVPTGREAAPRTFPQHRRSTKFQPQQDVLVEILGVKVRREQIYPEQAQRLIELHQQSNL